MTSPAAAPLPVLYLPPPDPGMLSDLLLHEVAACVAAVGHRLHVLPRPPGAVPRTVPDAVAEFSAGHGREPVMVIIGRLGAGLEAQSRTGDVTVTLDGAGPAEAAASALTLPTRSRSLCRMLARSADPPLPGRALVLAHRGDGAGGDDGWPGLSWGLTLLLGGPGRGVLVDLQGTGGGLGSRLRTATGRIRPDSVPYAGASVPYAGASVPVVEAAPGAAPAPTPAPTPGPALAARLPAAGGVRWWSMAGPVADLLPGVGAAVDTFQCTVLDVGRNERLAQDLAAEGLPVLSVTGQDGTCCLEPVPGPGDRLAVEPSLWTGPAPASWARAARRRVSINLAARLTMSLSRERAEVRR
ncbi:MAG: hypothetical protein QJR09_11120 [Micrococcus sp.]|nr:hypothetical protein [Micrococcus sp.]